MLRWVTRFIDKNKDRWEEEKKGRDRERKMTLEMWEGLTMEEKLDKVVADKVQEELPGDERWSRIQDQRGENVHKSLVREGTLEATKPSQEGGGLEIEELAYRGGDLEATLPGEKE